MTIEQLEEIFVPKFVTGPHQKFTIKETQSSTQHCNEIEVINGNLIHFDVDIKQFNSIVSIFKEETEGLSLKKKCDGVFIHNSNEQWYLLLIELKDKINENTLIKALQQMISTQIKIFHLLQLHNAFKLDSYQPKFFLVGIIDEYTEKRDIKFKRGERRTQFERETTKLFKKFQKEKSLILDDSLRILKHQSVNNHYFFQNTTLDFVECKGCLDLSKFNL
jgi:hypothetical protein